MSDTKKLLKVSAIKINPDNPRIIKDEKYKQLLQSLKDFPEMAEVREVVVNKEHMILGGNMRFRAMKEAGWTEIPVRVVDWPADKQREFIAKDNANFGDWDYDVLSNQYELEELSVWGIDLTYLNHEKTNAKEEWIGMPDYGEDDSRLKIIINFETEADREEFIEKTQLPIQTKGKIAFSTWYPFKERESLKGMKIE